jgi:hypothetical protein
VGFGGLLVTAARAELQYSLDTDAQTLQLLPDDVFRHVSAKVLDQQPYTAVLREGESVKTHTLAPVEGPQCTDRGPEAIGSPRNKHKLLPLHLG